MTARTFVHTLRRSTLRLLGIFALLALLLPALPAVPVRADTHTVTSLLDDGGPNTLRQAIADAVAGDTIAFASGLTGTITLTTGTLTIDKNLTINGPGANVLAVDGNNTYQGFFVTSAVTAATVSGLTIQHGNSTNSAGNGILNLGNLTVTNSTVSANTASWGAAGIDNEYGAVMVLTNSTVSGNSSPYSGGGIGNSGTLTVTNSTVSGNSSIVNNGKGGGIFNNNVGALTVINSTIAGNSATAGGGIYNQGGTVSLTNTIVATNSAPSGPDISGGYGGMHNLIGGSPLLAPLGNYGGPTQTRALLPGSPALDTGAPVGGSVPNTDQRGIARPQGSGVDIGAFEARFSLMATGGNTQSAPVSQPFAQPLAVTFGGADAPATLSGVAVTFTANPAPNGASATLGTPNPATTDASGVANVTATANSIAGAYSVTASARGAANVSFALTNIPGPPASIVASGGTPQSAPIGTPFATPLAATVTDSGGNPVADGTPVIFTAPATGASANFPNGGVATTTDGVAAILATANMVVGGPYTVTATSNGHSAIFTLTNTVGAESSLTVGAGTTTQSAPLTTTFGTPLSVTATNSGIPLSGVPITFIAPASGASGTFAGGGTSITVQTDASGVATAPPFTANTTLGAYYVLALDDQGHGAFFFLTNTPGATATLTVTGYPSPVVVGTAHSFTVTGKDAYGNLTPAYTGTVRFITGSDPLATLPADYAFTGSGSGKDNGVHTFIATFGTPGVQNITATDTATSGITGSQPGIAVTPTITGISPMSSLLDGGATITITGTGFMSGTTVAFGGTAATNVVVDNATKLTARAPAHAAGVVDVVVTVQGQTATLANAFTYGVVNPRPAAPPPVFDPQSGSPTAVPPSRGMGPTGVSSGETPNPLPTPRP